MPRMALLLVGAAVVCATPLEPLEPLHRQLHRQLQDKSCHAVPAAQCGTTSGTNTCLKCGPGSTYDCEQCCPGLTRTTVGGYSYCAPGKGPTPPPPSPPHSRCAVTLEELCGRAQKQGTTACNNCLKSHWTQLQKAACSLNSIEGFCKGGGPPPPSPGGTYGCYGTTCYPGKGTLSKAACETSCSGPPGPPPGGDSWDSYTVGPLAVTSVTGGSDKTKYDKVVVMLHGGGSSGDEWTSN
jgi:hypothetical protein